MKSFAYSVLEPGLDVDKRELELESPRAGELRIRITHCVVGQGDVGFLKNLYQITGLTYPLTAGHELVGEVVVLGKGSKGFALGDRVGVGYQVWSCGTCMYCKSAREQYCQRQRCLVLNEQGGFASHMNVDARFAFKIPSAIASADAAPLFCSGLTVFSAIKKSGVEAGMVVGVVGVGGLGHVAVQILNYYGPRVTAFSSKTGDLVKRLGAQRVVGYESDDLKPQTFDKIFLTTHKNVDHDYYLNLLKSEGQLWVIGSATDKSTFSSWRLNDFAGRSIHGSYIGSPDEMRELLRLAAKHKIHGSVKVMPMDRVKDALQIVEKGSSHFRIVAEN